MYGQEPASTEHAKRLRKKGGAWLKQQRLNAGLIQYDIAKAFDFRGNNTVSEWETGKMRPAAEHFIKYALLLGLKPSAFAAKMLEFYHPHIHQALNFKGRPAKPPTSVKRR